MSVNKRFIMSSLDIDWAIEPDFTGLHTTILLNERIMVLLGADRPSCEEVIES